MYSNLEELKKRIAEEDLLQFTDDEHEGAFTVENPNPAYRRVLQAISDADTVIDASIRGRLPVPFTDPIPAVIVQISTIFAIHYLYGRKPELEMTESFKQLFKTHKELLSQIQSGTMILPGLEAAAAKPPFVRSNKVPADRYFNSDRMGAFRGDI